MNNSFLLEADFTPLIVMLLIVMILAFVAIFTIYKNTEQKKHKQFVIEHSVALKHLEALNRRYAFIHINNYDMVHEYDNEHFFDDVSPEDYLTYQLVYKQQEIREAIKYARENARKHPSYLRDIDAIATGEFDADTSDYSMDMLTNMESFLFNSTIQKPIINFKITVTLYETSIRGRVRGMKDDSFNTVKIEAIMNALNNKRGDFYLDEGIWDSICRVERAKVSNKLRFAIYERDGHRCCKCHRRTGNLEIDHIFPISKGGKSTYDNLQTLCHECNVKKSNKIEEGARNPRIQRQYRKMTCPSCGAPMLLKKGRNGEFYGCSNYPNCRQTLNV